MCGGVHKNPNLWKSASAASVNLYLLEVSANLPGKATRLKAANHTCLTRSQQAILVQPFTTMKSHSHSESPELVSPGGWVAGLGLKEDGGIGCGKHWLHAHDRELNEPRPSNPDNVREVEHVVEGNPLLDNRHTGDSAVGVENPRCICKGSHLLATSFQSSH